VRLGSVLGLSRLERLGSLGVFSDPFASLRDSKNGVRAAWQRISLSRLGLLGSFIKKKSPP